MQELLHCQNVCQQISAGIRGLQTGSVTVGTAYSASYAWISEAAADFHSQYPGMDIDNLRVLKACKVQPNTRFSTMDSYAACAMVEAGLGITMNNGMNRPTVDDGIKIVPLDPPQKVMVGIAAMRDLSPAAERFLDFLLKKQR